MGNNKDDENENDNEDENGSDLHDENELKIDRFIKIGGEIYLPLFASGDIKNSWELNSGFDNPLNRASFILNLNAINPIKLAKNAMK
jgi:hypothetical protein